MRKDNFFGVLVLFLCLSACNNLKQPEQVLNDTHSSRGSVDWPGLYRGILPCADCEGIQISIQLKKDLTYVITTQYLGRSPDLQTQKGSFEWNKEGSCIRLLSNAARDKIEVKDEFKVGEESGDQYLVGENQLIKLDKEGKRVEGPLAQNYVLRKYDFDKEIREKYWKLFELYGKPIVPGKNQTKEAHFILKNMDLRISGHGGCNAFGGTYELQDGNRIHFSQMISTQMFCEDVDYESGFLNVLQNTDNYTIHGDTLCLNKARMAPLARFVAVYFR